MSLIHSIHHKTCLLALALSPLFAFAHVELSDYGLRAIEPTAICVSQRISASASSIVANNYYSPTTQIGGTCQSPFRVLSTFDASSARDAFLSALSDCVGHRVTSDGDLLTRRIADGVAIIAADGLRDNMTGESLLDKFNKGTNICNPPPKYTSKYR